MKPDQSYDEAQIDALERIAAALEKIAELLSDRAALRWS